MAGTYRIDYDQIEEHFNLDEFAHHEGNTRFLYMSDRFFTFARLLEMFRIWYNRPMHITSGYRPVEYNSKVGGSKNSAHLKMLAVDFKLPLEFVTYDDERKEEFLQNVKSKWTELCEAVYVSPQVNFYDTYLHLGIQKYGTSPSYLDKRSKKK